jgi:hypothetical protein
MIDELDRMIALYMGGAILIVFLIIAYVFDRFDQSLRKTIEKEQKEKEEKKMKKFIYKVVEIIDNGSLYNVEKTINEIAKDGFKISHIDHKDDHIVVFFEKEL